jgi:hypothetical protein
MGPGPFLFASIFGCICLGRQTTTLMALVADFCYRHYTHDCWAVSLPILYGQLPVNISKSQEFITSNSSSDWQSHSHPTGYAFHRRTCCISSRVSFFHIGAVYRQTSSFSCTPHNWPGTTPQSSTDAYGLSRFLNQRYHCGGQSGRWLSRQSRCCSASAQDRYYLQPLRSFRLRRTA